MKETKYFWIKFLLLFFSLLLLVVVLYILIITVEQVFGDYKQLRLLSIYLLIPALILFTLFLALTVKEYKSQFYLKQYQIDGRSYLTIESVLENETRNKILEEILINPGVHYNELLRNCSLQKGQLQWHLNILLKYKIIKKKRYGQYSLFFPITSSIEEINNYKNLLPKSKTTNDILNIIKENPGTTSSEISRITNLSRNTIKYHIDKLSEEGLIVLNRKGRKIELKPIQGELQNS